MTSLSSGCAAMMNTADNSMHIEDAHGDRACTVAGTSEHAIARPLWARPAGEGVGAGAFSARN